MEPKHRKRDTHIKNMEETDIFSHQFFIAQIFDAVKVLPPTKQ